MLFLDPLLAWGSITVETESRLMPRLWERAGLPFATQSYAGYSVACRVVPTILVQKNQLYSIKTKQEKEETRNHGFFFLIEKSFQGFLILKPRLALVNLVVFCTLAYSELQSSLNKKTREMEKFAGRIFWEMEFVYSTTHVILEWDSIYFKLKCFFFSILFASVTQEFFKIGEVRYPFK